MSFRCFWMRGGRGGERTFKMKEPGLRGGRGGWERTLRGRKRNWRMGNGTLRREKQGFLTGRNKDFEKEKIESHESCDFIAVFS